MTAVPDLSTASEGSLFAEFERCFQARTERVALSDPGGAPLATYGELLAEASRLANALAVLGVEAGDRVTVQVEKSVAGVALYLAVLKLGAVFQPLNTAYTDAEVDYFVGDARPKVIVGDPARQTGLRAIADRHGVFAVVNMAADGGGSLADLAARMDPVHQTVHRDGADLAGLCYTSGTTGRSKGAMITHDNLRSNAKALVELWRMTAADRLIHALPVFHVHGLYVALNTSFLAGCEICWLPRFDIEALLSALPRSSLMMGVPTFYTRLLADARFGRDVTSTMRLFISGSAPLLAETHSTFEARTGHAILERYGMTETGMIASNPYEGERLAGTVGFALPGVSVRIRGTEPGVIEVKGPNVFKGYWRMPEKTSEDFTPDGYFRTGDLGALAADGRLTIVGRARDLIISGGYNVYPKEVESELDGMEGVIESAVFGLPHPDLGEAVVAAVVAAHSLPDESRLIEALSRRLARFKLPKRIIVMAELPRNAMGKVQKAELRRTFAQLFAKP